MFVKRLGEKTELVKASDSKQLLESARISALSMPLVKQDGKWFFDVARGARKSSTAESDAMNSAPSPCYAYSTRNAIRRQDRVADGVLGTAQYPDEHFGEA